MNNVSQAEIPQNANAAVYVRTLEMDDANPETHLEQPSIPHTTSEPLQETDWARKYFSEVSEHRKTMFEVIEHIRRHLLERQKRLHFEAEVERLQKAYEQMVNQNAMLRIQLVRLKGEYDSRMENLEKSLAGLQIKDVDNNIKRFKEEIHEDVGMHG